MTLLTRSSYEFSELKRTIIHKKDEVKLEVAAEMVATAMSILEMIDDEYAFPTSEYESLSDIRTDLINYSNDKDWMKDG